MSARRSLLLLLLLQSGGTRRGLGGSATALMPRQSAAAGRQAAEARAQAVQVRRLVGPEAAQAMRSLSPPSERTDSSGLVKYKLRVAGASADEDTSDGDGQRVRESALSRSARRDAAQVAALRAEGLAASRLTRSPTPRLDALRAADASTDASADDLFGEAAPRESASTRRARRRRQGVYSRGLRVLPPALSARIGALLAHMPRAALRDDVAALFRFYDLRDSHAAPLVPPPSPQKGAGSGGSRSVRKPAVGQACSIRYRAREALAYLAGPFASVFGATERVFEEISARLPGECDGV
jgi:hypothetical protein